MSSVLSSKRPSEISIQRDNDDFYSTWGITIDNRMNKYFITTIQSGANLKSHVRKWINEIQKLYCKKTKENLIVTISAVNLTDHDSDSKKYSVYDLLQFCVGSHCLVMEMDIDRGQYFKENKKTVQCYTEFPRAMKDLLSHNRTIVAGVGIGEIVNKLEKDCNFLISKKVELRKEAAKKVCLANFDNYSVIRLADVVLDGEIVYEKPNKIECFDHSYRYFTRFSSEFIKHVTVEAFLLHSMASKLLKNKF